MRGLARAKSVRIHRWLLLVLVASVHEHCERNSVGASGGFTNKLVCFRVQRNLFSKQQTFNLAFCGRCMQTYGGLAASAEHMASAICCWRLVLASCYTMGAATYSLRPFLIVAYASRKTTTDNYILKNINIYNT